MGLLDQAKEKYGLLMQYIEANTPRSTRPVAKPGKVFDEGLINPNQYNAPAANRFKDSAFGLLGVVPGVSDAASAAESADLFNRGENFAGSMAALGALPLVPSIGGMFIGKGAKTWDVLKAQQADELLKQGIDPREVWKQTGTMRGVDNALRQEIPDNAARMVDPDTTPGLLDKMIAADPSSKGLKGIPQAMALEDVLRHPELDRAYFNVREDAPSVMFDSLGSTRGNYSDGFVTLNNANILDAEPTQRSTMLHELQHAIQQREGWARGGSPEELARRYQSAQDEYDLMFQTMKANPERADEIRPILDSLRNEYRDLANPQEAYRRLAGEAEARLTQSRMGLDAAQRLEHYPYDAGPYGFDVPADQQIVRGLLDGPALSYADEAAQKGGGLLGKVDNAGMDYVVNSRGSMGHEIVKDGKVVGLVKTGKAKDAIGTFMKQQDDALMAKKAKAEAAKASSANRAARKAEIEALSLANAQYADVISSAHKNKNLEFMPLPDGVFGMKGNPLIHQSPSYGKKPGSSYELVMVDGRPAYARASDHWGMFSTNDFVNGEQVSNTYNWPLSGVETKPYGDIRRSGYVFLDDLLKK